LRGAGGLGELKECVARFDFPNGRSIAFLRPVQTIVIGHKNPDMDSVCSALGYAELKRQLGWTDVVAARAGATNERIDFVLEKFGLQPPILMNDVSPRVRDVMQKDVVSVHADTPLYDAIQLIERRRLRGLPGGGQSAPMPGTAECLQDHATIFFRRERKPGAARTVVASLADIMRTLGGGLVCGELSTEPLEYFLVVGAMRQDSFRTSLGQIQWGWTKVVVFVGDRPHIQQIAIEHRAAAVVVTGGTPVEPEVEIAARAGRRDADHFSVGYCDERVDVSRRSAVEPDAGDGFFVVSGRRATDGSEAPRGGQQCICLSSAR
jgi:manganese-dependent inorganic pyrophosphatase